MQALDSTLRSHPLLHIQEQQVRSTQGFLLRAKAQFDPVLQSDLSQSHLYQPFTGLQRMVFDTTSSTEYLTSFSTSATQQFRNGVSAGPSLDVGRVTDSVAAPFGLNQSHLAFQVNIPLLRGRGRDVVAAQERAAEIEVDASLFDLNQTISDLLAATAIAYWNTVASREMLRVYAEAEARAGVYVQTVKTLIEADKLPRAEISQVLANLASKSASRIGAEQRLTQTRQQLGIAMGWNVEQMESLPGAADPLPPAEMRFPAGYETSGKLLIADSLARRADLLAATRRRQEADVLLTASRNSLKPQLDFRLGTGYSGLREGSAIDRYLIAPFTGIRGLDLIGGIHYQFPAGNHAAEGFVVQADSAARQAEYRAQERARNIVSDVVVALDVLRQSVRQLDKAQESIGYSQTALDNEREKLRLGVGSLVDILTVEDRLNAALVAGVEAKLNVALGLARLRQATGTIIEPDKAVHDVDQKIFFTPPEFASRRP